MAECAALPSCNHPRLQRSQGKAHCPVPKILLSGILERKLLYGKHKLIFGLPLQKMCLVYPSLSTRAKEDHHFKWNNLRCHYFGTLANPESLAPANWVPIIDQVLLMFSIVLAYMAGAVPHPKPFFNNVNRRGVDEAIGAENASASEKQRVDLKQKHQTRGVKL